MTAPADPIFCAGPYGWEDSPAEAAIRRLSPADNQLRRLIQDSLSHGQLDAFGWFRLVLAEIFSEHFAQQWDDRAEEYTDPGIRRACHAKAWMIRNGGELQLDAVDELLNDLAWGNALARSGLEAAA